MPYCCCAGKRLSIPNAPQALCRVAKFPQAYALALGILTLGCLLLAVWLALLILNALDYTSFSFLSGLLEVAALTAVGGILFGGLLDYLALRKTRLI